MNIKNETKKCQAEKSVIMQPVKPQMDVQSKKSTSRSSKNKKLIGIANGKNCQATICENTDSRKSNFKEF